MSAQGSTLEARILGFVAHLPDGAGADEIALNVTGAEDKAQLVEVLNRMLSNRSVTLLRTAGGLLRYKAAGAREQKTKGLHPEELMVFQHIQKAANSGVWTKDLKIRTNLAQPQITKILKALEARGLIKSIKSVVNPSRKLVMLAELEPSKEVTGGAWYTDSQQFDVEFIAIVRDALLRYIERAGEASLSSITAWIMASGLVKNVDLTREDVQQVLDSLTYEGQIDSIEREGEDDEVYRRAVEKYPPTTALTSVPCGRCPVIDHCREGGPISPQTCEYYAKWLDF